LLKIAAWSLAGALAVDMVELLLQSCDGCERVALISRAQACVIPVKCSVINQLFSAYCGGLWIAALRCMVAAAQELGQHVDVEHYRCILNRAVESYQKHLWNGK